MQINREGCTRIVILTKRFAVKIPNIFSWRLMLYGLLANHQERTFSRLGWPEVCPIRFSLPFAVCVVMEKAQPMTFEQWQSFDYESFCIKESYKVPVELKRDSFGWLNGRVVAVDYGN